MSMTAAMSAASSADVIHPVLIVRMDIEDDPVTVWTGHGLFAPTGTGDAALDSQVFSAVAGIGEISDFVSKEGMADPVTATLFGVDIDDPLLRQIIRDGRKWRGKPCWIWMGFYDLSDPDRPIVAYPRRMKYGVLTKIEVQRGKDIGAVIATIDEDEDAAYTEIHRYDSQRDFFSADEAADYMHLLANSPKGIHGSNYTATSAEDNARAAVEKLGGMLFGGGR